MWGPARPAAASLLGGVRVMAYFLPRYRSNGKRREARRGRTETLAMACKLIPVTVKVSAFPGTSTTFRPVNVTRPLAAWRRVAALPEGSARAAPRPSCGPRLRKLTMTFDRCGTVAVRSGSAPCSATQRQRFWPQQVLEWSFARLARESKVND